MNLAKQVSSPFRLRRNYLEENKLLNQICSALEIAIKIQHRMGRNSIFGELHHERDCDNYDIYRIVPSGYGSWLPEQTNTCCCNDSKLDFTYILNGVRKYIEENGFEDYTVYFKKREKTCLQKRFLWTKEIPTGSYEYKLVIELGWKTDWQNCNYTNGSYDEWPALVEQKINERKINANHTLIRCKKDFFISIIVWLPIAFLFIGSRFLPLDLGYNLIRFFCLILFLWFTSALIFTLFDLKKRFLSAKRDVKYAHSTIYQSLIEEETFR